MQDVIQPSPYNNLSIDRVLINWKLASGEKKKKEEEGFKLQRTNSQRFRGIEIEIYQLETQPAHYKYNLAVLNREQ